MVAPLVARLEGDGVEHALGPFAVSARVAAQSGYCNVQSIGEMTEHATASGADETLGPVDR
jgi:hypothetical protein